MFSHSGWGFYLGGEGKNGILGSHIKRSPFSVWNDVVLVLLDFMLWVWSLVPGVFGISILRVTQCVFSECFVLDFVCVNGETKMTKMNKTWFVPFHSHRLEEHRDVVKMSHLWLDTVSPWSRYCLAIKEAAVIMGVPLGGRRRRKRAGVWYRHIVMVFAGLGISFTIIRIMPVVTADTA